MVLLLQVNQALFSAPQVFTSPWVHRERNVWVHRESISFPSIKIPTVGLGRGGAWRSHAATSCSASSDICPKVTKELVGTDMENIPKGMQMVIVSFFCCCFVCFSSKIQKHPPHPPAFSAALRLGQSHGPAAALLSLLLHGTTFSS